MALLFRGEAHVIAGRLVDSIVSPEFSAALIGHPAHFVVRPAVVASERSFEDLGQESEGWVVFLDPDRSVCPGEQKSASDLLDEA